MKKFIKAIIYNLYILLTIFFSSLEVLSELNYTIYKY